MRRSEPWPVGTPCWLQILTPDVAATLRFYGELFGWDYRDPDPSGRIVATLHGLPVAGLLSGPVDYPPVWIVHLAVDDLDATRVAIDLAGGQVPVPSIDLPGGRTVVGKDATLGVFCLWQAGADIGCEIVNEPGSFVWSELLTDDYAAAKRFYADVFGLGVTDIGGDVFDFATLSVGGTAAGNVVGGIGVVPDDHPPDVPSYWRVYFAAADTDAVVASAVALGASVTIAAHDTPFGRWAGLTDPLGARFCVITPPTEP